MILSFRLTQLSPKWIAALLAVVGVVLMGVSVRSASGRVQKLRAWPRVDARVHGGDVVSLLRRGQREAMYAGRLQLQYDFRDQRYTVPATEEVYSSHYAGQARGVLQAIRDGRVNVLLDPNQPSTPVLNAGYNAEFFFTSLIFGWMGVLFTFLAVVFWRAFRSEAPDARKKAATGGGATWIAAFFAVLGVGFVSGGAFAFWSAQRQLTTWKPVDARIDSSDVVWRSSSSRGSGSANSGSSRVNLYAARAWITYTLGDSAYHVPVVKGAYVNDSGGARDRAGLLLRAGSMRARVDPGNPFDAALEPPGAVSRFWLPALFIVPWLVCLFLTWLIGRKKKTRRPRRPKRRAEVNPVPPEV